MQGKRHAILSAEFRTCEHSYLLEIERLQSVRGSLGRELTRAQGELHSLRSADAGPRHVSMVDRDRLSRREREDIAVAGSSAAASIADASAIAVERRPRDEPPGGSGNPKARKQPTRREDNCESTGCSAAPAAPPAAPESPPIQVGVFAELKQAVKLHKSPYHVGHSDSGTGLHLSSRTSGKDFTRGTRFDVLVLEDGMAHVVAYSLQRQGFRDNQQWEWTRCNIVYKIAASCLSPLIAAPMLAPISLSDDVELAATFLLSIASWSRLSVVAQLMLAEGVQGVTPLAPNANLASKLTWLLNASNLWMMLHIMRGCKFIGGGRTMPAKLGGATIGRGDGTEAPISDRVAFGEGVGEPLVRAALSRIGGITINRHNNLRDSYASPPNFHSSLCTPHFSFPLGNTVIAYSTLS